MCICCPVSGPYQEHIGVPRRTAAMREREEERERERERRARSDGEARRTKIN